MHRTIFAVTTVLTLFLMSCVTNGSGNKLPNIVLILCDDMGVECLSCNGALDYSTPNLDRLAGEGINFKMCFSQPLCTPSRVKIMTGIYNYSNYLDFAYMDTTVYTFGNMLKEAGYQTAIAGKWQLNGIKEWSGWDNMDRPVTFGFDEYCLWQLTYRGNRYPMPYMEQDGRVLSTTMDDYGPDIACNYLLDFMERNKDVPFLAYYPMILVHNPFRPTPDSPEWQDSTKRMDSDNRYFKDMVEYTDKLVGKIDAKLAELGVRDNTLLIFLGDNGTNDVINTSTVNGPYQGGKGTCPNAGTHVPMIVSWPLKIKEGFETDCLVEFSDFLPTLADVARVEKPEPIDGKSFYPLLVGEDYTPRKTVFVHFDPKMKLWGKMKAGRFVRTSVYKLYYDGRLYNLEQDPLELNPLEINSLTEEEKIILSDLKKEMDTAPEWIYVDENFKGDLKR